MDSKGLIENWLQKKMQHELTWEEAYIELSRDIYDLDRTFRRTGHVWNRRFPPFRENLVSLKAYVKEYGFYHKGDWYFRTMQLDDALKSFLEERGAITKVGRLQDLKRLKVEIPENYKKYFCKGSPLFYKVNQAKIRID